jgi:hypothetical protein
MMYHLMLLMPVQVLQALLLDVYQLVLVVQINQYVHPVKHDVLIQLLLK